MEKQLFVRKPAVFEAYKWEKNGDHPNDDVFRPFEDTCLVPTEPREGKVVRYYRMPNSGNRACINCGKPLHDHGFIDNPNNVRYCVCPGDWVITEPGNNYSVLSDANFTKLYEPYVLR